MFEGAGILFLFSFHFPHRQEPAWNCTCTVVHTDKIDIISIFVNRGIREGSLR